jgi:hypothetical protein
MAQGSFMSAPVALDGVDGVLRSESPAAPAAPTILPQ